MEWRVRKLLVYVLVPAMLSGLFVSSCGRGVPVELMEIETYIDDSPAQALSALDSIPSVRLKSFEARAKYALLKSMALDKNYVDVLSDSIISPAVKYYARHGSADDKLKTCYYRGLIPYYSGDYDEAMEWFTRAGRYADKASDKTAVGLLYNKLGIIYSFVFDQKKSLESFDRASRAFLAAADTSRYIDELESALNCCIVQQEYKRAAYYDDALRGVLDCADEPQKSSYFASRIQLAANDGTLSLKQLTDYMGNFPDSLLNWKAIIGGYAHLGEAETALTLLEQVLAEDIEPSDLPAYYSFLSGLYAETGDYRSAYEFNRKYSVAEDERDMQVFQSDIKTVQSNLQAEMSAQKHRYSMLITILTSVIAVMLLSILLILVSRRLRRRTAEHRAAEAEKAETLKMLESARAELANLSAIKEDRDKSMSEETINAIDERLEVLSDCVKSVISGYNSEAIEHLRSLMGDREHFLSSTREMFMLSHIEFISYLQQKGLSRNEISICCLISLGFTGKELSTYMNIPNSTYRNRIYAMRKKLGLANDNREISTVLKELLKN